MKNVCTPLNNSQKSLESPKKPCGCGASRAKSKQPLPKEDTEGTVSKKSLRRPKETSSMLESHQQNNKKIWKDKLPCCNLNTLTMKLSPTLDQESTLRGKDCKPFWNSRFEDVYRQLWWPTETGLPDLPSNSLNSSSNNITLHWKSCQAKIMNNQSTNLPKTSWLSLQFSPPVTTAPENTMFSRKLRIYPNKEQRALFQKCLGAYRYFYNKTNSFIKESMSRKEDVRLSLPALRSHIMKSDKDISSSDSEHWQKDVPYDVRQEAISDNITAWKTNFKKQKMGLIKSFRVGFKSKKQTSQMFRVNKKALNIITMTIFVKRLNKKGKLRMRKRDISKYLEDGTLDGNFLVMKTKPDYWYLCLPRKKNLPVYDEPRYKAVFLDPGVRSFQTFYSPEGTYGHITCSKEIKKLSKRHDNLQSISSTCNSKTKRHMNQRMAKLRHKMKNIVNDLHWKACSFLCSNFETIVIPPFKVSDMVSGSPLGSKVTRSILSLSHGKFQERLRYFATKTQRYYLVSCEGYTTKTCGRCGNIQEMQGDKVYNCKSCSASIDRDVNGARNLCLRTLTTLME